MNTDVSKYKRSESYIKSKGDLLAAMWRVYSTLIEYSFPSSYQFHIQKVTEAAKDQREHHEKHYKGLLAEEEAKIERASKEIDKLSSQAMKMKQEMIVKE